MRNFVVHLDVCVYARARWPVDLHFPCKYIFIKNPLASGVSKKIKINTKEEREATE